jgi:hypothetical protein
MDMGWKMGSALRAGFKYGLLASLGAVSCVAGLTPKELQQIEDYGSICGCSISRLLFNLVGGKGSLWGITSQEEIFTVVSEWLLSLYEALPPDPIAPGKKLGEINYPTFGLFPSPGTGRPFEVNDPIITSVFPLDKQRQLKEAFVAYNESFFSPGNLARLRNAADAITDALALYIFEGAVPELYQNFAYQHMCYLTHRLPDDYRSLFQMILQDSGGLQRLLAAMPSPSQLVPPLRHLCAFLGELPPAIRTGIRDHSRKFRPHILAIFNLAQSAKTLCAFLGENPLVTLKECAVLVMRDSEMQEVRGLIIVYEMMVAEFIECLKALDNELFAIASGR